MQARRLSRTLHPDRRTAFAGASRRRRRESHERRNGMSDLIAIGYDDETTAIEAMNETERLAQELIIQPDAIAAIIRNKEGKYKVVTNHHMVGAGATWG